MSEDSGEAGRQGQGGRETDNGRGRTPRRGGRERRGRDGESESVEAHACSAPKVCCFADDACTAPSVLQRKAAMANSTYAGPHQIGVHVLDCVDLRVLAAQRWSESRAGCWVRTAGSGWSVSRARREITICIMYRLVSVSVRRFFRFTSSIIVWFGQSSIRIYTFSLSSKTSSNRTMC